MEKLVMNEMLSAANIHVPTTSMAGGDLGSDDDYLYNQLFEQLGGKKKRSGKKKSGKKKKSKKSKKSHKGGGSCTGNYQHGNKSAGKKKSKRSGKKRKGSKKKKSKRGGSMKNKQYGGYIRYDDEFNLF